MIRGRYDYGRMVRDAKWLALKMEDGDREPRGVGQPLEAEEGREMGSPLDSPERSTTLATP